MIPGSDQNLKKWIWWCNSGTLGSRGYRERWSTETRFTNGAQMTTLKGVASGASWIARSNPRKPLTKRSILIVMVKQKEMGLVGSSKFPSYPTVPKSAIVRIVNTDMPQVIAPFGFPSCRLWAEHSRCNGQNCRILAANYLGLVAWEIDADPEAGAKTLCAKRSIQFALYGIPGFTLKYGNKSDIPRLIWTL